MHPTRRVLLYAITVGCALVEAIGLRATGMVATLPLAAQASALPAIAAFHDDRWLIVYASNWPVLAGELAAAVGVRTAITTACVLSAWPGTHRPHPVRVAARAAIAYCVLLVALSPWALLSMVTAVVSQAYPLVGAVVGAGALAVLVLPHAGIAPWWWTRVAPWRAMAWSVVDLAVVTATAVGIAYSPGWVVLAPAVVAGLLNGWCWERFLTACAARAAPGRAGAPAAGGAAPVLVPPGAPGRVRRATAPVLLGAVVVGLAVAMASGIPAIGRSFPESGHGRLPPPRRGQQAVLLVSGYQSRWNGGPPAQTFRGDYTTEYSYRGSASTGAPLPYSSINTTRSLPALASLLASQVRHLAAETGRKVDVVAVSEGTYVVREYLARHPTPPLHAIVLASPLPRPDRVYVPPVGRTGYGFVAGLEMSGILEVSRAEDPTLDISVDMPMVRSLLAQGPLFRQRSLCPAAGVRVVALLPLTAAVDDPPGPVAGVPAGVEPALHATLVDTASIRHDMVAVLAGHRTSTYFGWGLGYQLLRYAASAAEAPSLPLDAVGAWRRAGAGRFGDAAFGRYGCRAVDHPSTAGP